MGKSKFKKEHDEQIKKIADGTIKIVEKDDNSENNTEIRARKCGIIGFEFVNIWRIRELEDREQKWKKQNKQIKQLKQQLSEKNEIIAELKDRLEYITGNESGVVKVFDITEHDKEIRHQVVKEIIEKSHKENRHLIDHEKLETIDGTLYTISGYALYQIEQGE